MYRSMEPHLSNNRTQPWAGFVTPVILWFCVSLGLRYGCYSDCELVLGPNSSRLVQVSSFFVERIKLRDETAQGLLFFGFSVKPHLSTEINWTLTKDLVVDPYKRQGISVWLNKGSRIVCRWKVGASGFQKDLLVVILKGDQNFRRWLRDPKNASIMESWQQALGTGKAEYTVEENASYYLEIVNLGSRSLRVSLAANISSKVYDTSKALCNCSMDNGPCSLELLFSSKRYAVVTTPTNLMGGTTTWNVELSYMARVASYCVILAIIIVVVYIVMKCFGGREEEEVVVGAENQALLNDDTKQHSILTLYGTADECSDSAAINSCQDLYDAKICVICYDKIRNSFFVPCGHCATCYTCAQRIESGESKSCPICRRTIQKVRRLCSS
ncbi:hypothetical protein AMTRI_Chr12g269920 [Amborella trichopoda]